MYLIVWRYTVKAGKDAEFRRSYGPAGEWDRFFQMSPAFLGTTLVTLEAAGHYLTIDSWTDEAAFDEFLVQHRRAYDELDAKFEDWTVSEELIGRGRSG